MCFKLSFGIPIPSSLTDTKAVSFFSVVSILIVFSLSENLIALSIRLYSTCCILVISADTKSSFPERTRLTLSILFLHVPSNVSIVSLITLLMSKSVISKTMPVVFRLFSVRSELVSLVSLSVSFNKILRYLSCISGGIVPSTIASRYPLIEVRGERKS